MKYCLACSCMVKEPCNVNTYINCVNFKNYEIDQNIKKLINGYRNSNIFTIRLYNDRKKEMLFILDRSIQQVMDFIESMLNSDQDYAISNQKNLISVDKKHIEKYYKRKNIL